MRTKFLLAAATAVLAGAVAAAPGHAGPGGHTGGHGFAQLDTDNNGTITRAEIDAQSAARFAKIDADRDGFVTQAEMKAHHEAMRAQWAEKTEDRPAADGTARADKRAERMAKMGERMAKRGDRDPFAKRDADKDGRISLAEFQAGGAKMIERLDTNKDGAVTQDEMAKARAAWKAKRKG